MGEVDLSKLLIVPDDGPCAECTAGYHHGCTVWDRRCNCKGEADREAAVKWVEDMRAERAKGRRG